MFKVFDFGNIVDVFGLVTPAIGWKFSGVEQAWVGEIYRSIEEVQSGSWAPRRGSSELWIVRTTI